MLLLLIKILPLFNLPNSWMVNVTQHKTEEIALISLNFRNLQVKTNHKSNLKIQSHYEKALIKWNEDLGEKKQKEGTEWKHCRKLPASCTKAQGCASANELTLPSTNFIAVIRPCGYPKPWGKYKSKQLHLSPPSQAKPSLSLGVCYRHKLRRNAAAWVACSTGTPTNVLLLGFLGLFSGTSRAVWMQVSKSSEGWDIK